MPVDLLTFGVGSVDRASAIGPDQNLFVGRAKSSESLGSQFADQLASTSAAKRPANATSELSAAKKFEAIFVAQMMTSILPKDSEYFGEGFAGDAWRSMMSEQLANVAVKQTDFGIASLIEQGFANQSNTTPVAVGGETNSNSDLLGSFLKSETNK